MDGTLVTRFADHLLALGLAPTSISMRTQLVSQALRWLSNRGVTRVANLREEDLNAYLHHLRENGRASATLSHTSVALRQFTAWLASQGLVLTDPGADLAPVRKRSYEGLPPRPLTMSEVHALLAAVPLTTVIHLRNRAMLEILYGCGLRLGEGTRLRVEDLDHQRQSVLVRGKGGHERTLPIVPATWSALADYMVHRRSLVRGPDRGVLFLGRDGKGIRATAFRQWLVRLGRRVLGPDRHVFPHLLRHSIAVHLLLGKADIRHVQEFLGHADLDTTKIYLRLVPEEIRAFYDTAMPALLPTTLPSLTGSRPAPITSSSTQP